MLLRSEKPIANPMVVLREEFDDWAVLFNPDTAEAIGVNPIGVTIWKLMNGSRSLDGIVKGIESEYENVPGNAVDEISKFIETLTAKGFVGYEESGST